MVEGIGLKHGNRVGGISVVHLLLRAVILLLRPIDCQVECCVILKDLVLLLLLMECIVTLQRILSHLIGGHWFRVLVELAGSSHSLVTKVLALDFLSVQVRSIFEIV